MGVHIIVELYWAKLIKEREGMGTGNALVSRCFTIGNISDDKL